MHKYISYKYRNNTFENAEFLIKDKWSSIVRRKIFQEYDKRNKINLKIKEILQYREKQLLLAANNEILIKGRVSLCIVKFRLKKCYRQ